MPFFDGFTSDQVRAAERPLLDAGVPLMQRAAAGLADELRSVLTALGPDARRLVVLIGSGDNGGDALFAVAALAAQGCPVVLVLLGTRVHEVGLRQALAGGAELMDQFVVTPERVASLVADTDVVVDGLLGIGATGGLRSPAREVVEALLPLVPPHRPDGPRVVAVDLPSGLGPDDGAVIGPVLPAAVTVTFGAVKSGLLAPAAAGLVGRIRLVDIGLSDTLPPPARPAALVGAPEPYRASRARPGLDGILGVSAVPGTAERRATATGSTGGRRMRGSEWLV